MTLNNLTLALTPLSVSSFYSRALSPHLDSKISIHRHICNFVHIKVIGITGKGAVVWGIEWIVEKGRRGPITALGRRDNGAAKG